MTFQLSPKSSAHLSGVHPELVRVFHHAIATTDLDFAVLEGVRTLARQRQLFAQHATTTMQSRHLDGHAVDLAPLLDGQVSWDWPLYHRLAVIVKAAAAAENVAIEWGGDWTTFRDGPHWQLSWAAYP